MSFLPPALSLVEHENWLRDFAFALEFKEAIKEAEYAHEIRQGQHDSFGVQYIP